MLLTLLQLANISFVLNSWTLQKFESCVRSKLDRVKDVRTELTNNSFTLLKPENTPDSFLPPQVFYHRFPKAYGEVFPGWELKSNSLPAMEMYYCSVHESKQLLLLEEFVSPNLKNWHKMIKLKCWKCLLQRKFLQNKFSTRRLNSYIRVKLMH